MLHFGGDVANELDLLDFIDDEKEKREIILKYVLENVMPHIVWEDGTTGIDIATLGEENDTSLPMRNGGLDEKEDELSSKDDHFVAMSEENVYQHNARRGLQNT